MKLEIEVTPEMARFLTAMTRTGFHGRTEAEVAERLIATTLWEFKHREWGRDWGCPPKKKEEVRDAASE